MLVISPHISRAQNNKDPAIIVTQTPFQTLHFLNVLAILHVSSDSSFKLFSSSAATVARKKGLLDSLLCTRSQNVDKDYSSLGYGLVLLEQSHYGTLL